MYNTRVRFACPIYFSRDQSSSKLIIFLDSKLERSNSRVAKIDSRLDSRNFRGSRIESRVEFRNSRVTVNLPLSGTVHPFGPVNEKWSFLVCVCVEASTFTQNFLKYCHFAMVIVVSKKLKVHDFLK